MATMPFSMLATIGDLEQLIKHWLIKKISPFSTERAYLIFIKKYVIIYIENEKR